jgi:hypothetical protein
VSVVSALLSPKEKSNNESSPPVISLPKGISSTDSRLPESSIVSDLLSLSSF